MLNNKNMDFIIKLDNIEVELDKEIVVPTEVNGNKPSGYVARKQTKTVIYFKYLGFATTNDYEILIDDIFECLALIEVLKGYNYNKLSQDVKYDFKSFSAKAVKKDKTTKLRIVFHKVNKTIYISKVHCIILATQINKLIHKCEVLSQNNYFFLKNPSEIS